MCDVHPIIDAYATIEQLTGRDIKYIDNSAGKRYLFSKNHASKTLKFTQISMFADKVVFYMDICFRSFAEKLFDENKYKYDFDIKEVITKHGIRMHKVIYAIYFNDPQEVIEFDKSFGSYLDEIEGMYFEHRRNVF